MKTSDCLLLGLMCATSACTEPQLHPAPFAFIKVSFPREREQKTDGCCKISRHFIVNDSRDKSFLVSLEKKKINKKNTHFMICEGFEFGSQEDSIGGFYAGHAHETKTQDILMAPDPKIIVISWFVLLIRNQHSSCQYKV